jgi:hypothetical protein
MKEHKIGWEKMDLKTEKTREKILKHVFLIENFIST